MSSSTSAPFLIAQTAEPDAIGAAAEDAGGGFGAVVDYIAAGGFFMVLLLICSLFAIALIIYKFLHLQRMRILPPSLERSLASLPETRELPEIHGDSPLATIAREAFDERHRTAAAAREAAEVEARSQFNALGRGISLLDTIVTIAPLLGLLGTVAGLVSVFSVLGDAGGDAPEHAALATGIARALGTTIAGLVVAIPAVIAYNHFNSVLEKLAVRVEKLVGHAISAFHDEGSAPPPPPVPDHPAS